MISHRQHDDCRRDGETGNILIVFRKSEEHFGNIFPFTMGVGTGDEGESQEEEEDNEEQADSGSQVNLNSSTQENEAYTDRGTGTMDQFGPWTVGT